MTFNDSAPVSERAPSSLRHRMLAVVRRIAAPAQIVIGLAAVAIGVALFLAAISVQTIAQLTGLGLVLIGIATFLTPRPAEDGLARLLPRIGGAVLILAGAVIALWPMSGAPWLAFLIGAALLVRGAIGVVQAFRRETDHRAAVLLTSLATLIVGALTFSWPVLTLVFFRLGVGAWFVFLGLQLLFAVLFRRRAAARPAQVAPPRHGWVQTVAAGIALVLAGGLALGSHSVLGGVPLPQPGPFYAAPDALPDRPGVLLRVEPLTQGVPDGAEAWKILYTTTHPDDTIAVSSGTVIAPAQRGSGTLPLITVAHGTTGVAPQCAPSLSTTPFADGAGTALAEMVTQQGWAAVTSDYIGLGTQGPHPYLIGDAEARNALDASRAALQMDELTLSTDTVIWGHSQGGQGALWAGQIAADYAPEFTVLGVAAFAPASDLFGLAEADKDTAPGKTVSAYIASTWNQIYPELELEKNLTPGSAGGVEKIAGLCFNGGDVLSAIVGGTQIPNQVFPNSLLDGTFGDLLKEQEPVGPWPAPVMVAQGLADPLVKPELQQDWVDSRCAAGEEIDYRTFPGLSHNSLVAADSPLTPQIVQWTLDRWNDAAPTPNCADQPQ